MPTSKASKPVLDLAEGFEPSRAQTTRHRPRCEKTVETSLPARVLDSVEESALQLD